MMRHVHGFATSVLDIRDRKAFVVLLCWLCCATPTSYHWIPAVRQHLQMNHQLIIPLI
jgi:hypothetical protein